MTAFRRTGHSVKFYADDASLCSTVTAFLGGSLSKGQPAILIATRDHEAAILRTLSGRDIDCETLVRAGVLAVRNAEETLNAFMVNGKPDRARFDQQVGSLVAGQSQRHKGDVVSAYGEMVDVLWKRGERQAAIELESLWNELATRHSFALLCGYAMGNFYKQQGPLGLEDVCAQHSDVVSDAHDYDPRVFPPPTRPL